MDIRVKNLDVLGIDEMLQEIYRDLRESGFGVFNTITSAFRSGDNGVHGTQPVRGLDLRCYSSKIGESAVKMLNARWEYDPKRPELKVALYHDVGQGRHLHLQCHPNTRRRVE